MKLLDKNALSMFFTRAERTIQLPLPPVTILGYHAISYDNTIVDVKPEDFKKQIALLKETCEFVTLDQVVRFILGKEKFSKPAVALTFDDGYMDVFINALPILLKENIPATAFVMSNPSYANRQELENNKKLMTTKEIKILHKLGWDIGCHSATHANFANGYLDVYKEIIFSKKQLEKQIGFQTKYFAYPKGIYSQNIMNVAKLAGFSASFAFESGFISSRTNLFSIPRMPVDWTHTIEQFNAFFTHWGILYLQTKQKFERNFGSV